MADYPISANPVYTTNIRALQDTDPARASDIFNPLFMKILDNIHAIKLAADTLAGVTLSGIVEKYSALPPADGLVNGVMYLVQKDETRLDSKGNPKSTIYKVVDGVWEYVRDYNAADFFRDRSVASEEGVFGLRYWDGKLQIKDGDEWIVVGSGGKVPEGSFSVGADGVLSSAADFGKVVPNEIANTLIVNEGFATVNGKTTTFI